MWKISACLLLVSIQCGLIGANGVGWGSGGGSSQGSNNPYNPGSGSSIPSGSPQPQYGNSPGTGGTNENYWWLSANPFQKPPNHPGVERGDVGGGGGGGSSGAGWGAPSRPSNLNGNSNNYGNLNNPVTNNGAGSYNALPANSQPSSGAYYTPLNSNNNNNNNAPSQPASIPPQSPVRVEPVNNNNNAQSSGPSYGGPPSAPGNGWNGGSPSSQSGAPPGAPPPPPPPKPFQNYKPPQSDFDCQLTNKADCHGGPGSVPAPAPAPVPAPVPAPAPAPVINSGYNQVDAPSSGSNQQYQPNNLPESGPTSSYTQPKPPQAPVQPSPINPGDHSYGSSSSSGSYSPPQNAQPPPAPQVSALPIPQTEPHVNVDSSYSPGPSSNPYGNTVVPQGPAPIIPARPPPYNPGPSNQYQSPPQPSAPAPSFPVQNNNNIPPVAQAPQYAPRPIDNTVSNSYNPPNNAQYQAKPFVPPSNPSYNTNQQQNSQPFKPQQNPQPFNQQQNYRPQPVQQPAVANYADQLPYPGCPAAMLCVPDNQCNSIGVIEERAIALSQAELAHRVALVSCSAPSTGAIGVCCRDPNYKDPWPDMNGGNNGGDKQHHHHHDGGKGQGGGNHGGNNQQYQPQQQQPSNNFNSYSGAGAGGYSGAGVGGGQKCNS